MCGVTGVTNPMACAEPHQVRPGSCRRVRAGRGTLLAVLGLPVVLKSWAPSTGARRAVVRGKIPADDEGAGSTGRARVPGGSVFTVGLGI